jgi:hypothetical protein
VERLALYMARCPLSLTKTTRVTDEGPVIYPAEEAECRRLPLPTERDHRKGQSMREIERQI